MSSIEEGSINICSQNQLYNNNNNNNNNNHDSNTTNNDGNFYHNNNISTSSTINNITSTIIILINNNNQDSHFHNAYGQKFRIGTRIIRKFGGVPYEGKVVGFNYRPNRSCNLVLFWSKLYQKWLLLTTGVRA